jgi:hypothetical protein
LLTASLKTPGKNITTYLLNLGNKPVEVAAQYANLEKPLKIQVYQVTKETLSKTDFRMEPAKNILLTGRESGLKEILPPRSLTIFTSYALRHSDDGMIRENP